MGGGSCLDNEGLHCVQLEAELVCISWTQKKNRFLEQQDRSINSLEAYISHNSVTWHHAWDGGLY